MKKIKLFIIAIISLAVLGLAGFNLYYFGWKKVSLDLQQKGFNIAVGEIIKQINSNGEVKINSSLILIKKPIQK
jgi:hypothetical protein